jgi:hypothetical protein
MKIMQKGWLIRHLVRKIRLALNRLKPLSQNLAILENLAVTEIFGRVQKVIVKWLPAPFVIIREERDL